MLQQPGPESEPESHATEGAELQSGAKIDVLEGKVLYLHYSFADEDRTILIQDCTNAGGNLVDETSQMEFFLVN